MEIFLIPFIMSTAAILISAGIVGYRTHLSGEDRPPKGTFLGILLISFIVWLMTFSVMLMG